MKSSESDTLWLNPEALGRLNESYATIRNTPAFQDLWGRLAAIEQKFVEEIIRGPRNPDGTDATPYFRIALHLLRQIAQIPDQTRAQWEALRSYAEDGPVANRENV